MNCSRKGQILHGDPGRNGHKLIREKFLRVRIKQGVLEGREEINTSYNQNLQQTKKKKNKT